MAGRHGNKGVISKIVPVEDTPYLDDGTPIDIVLNPLGVPSRMNVGQILETHLGWACAKLGEQVNNLLEDLRRGAKSDELKRHLKALYGDETNKDEIVPLQDDELVELGSNLVKGVPIATPVFDGAHESDIVELLARAGQDVSGQVTLYDGRTCEPFDR